MLLDDAKENEVWDNVYSLLHFKPDCSVRKHIFDTVLPFEKAESFAVYGIDCMTNEQREAMEDIVRNVFTEITTEKERIYALDWQHSSFLYDPRNLEEQKDIWVEDERYLGGGYMAYFPTFYPDGDYYFFIDEYFRFGYLGHPWRQEVWLFGDLLINKFSHVYHQLGWVKLK